MLTALVVTVPLADAEIAGDVLWSLGIRGIEERVLSRPSLDLDDDGELEVEDGDVEGGEVEGREVEDGGVEGVVELWTYVGETRAAKDAVQAALGGRWPLRWDEVDEAPSGAWRDHIGPMWIDDGFVVVPAWRQGDELRRTDVVVTIEPGGAFGMGDHPTTRLCLGVLRRLVAVGDALDVVDVGCGTGVIAVAAAVLTGRTVRAVDVSNAAVAATIDNAQRNGVGSLVVADDAPLSDVAAAYDVVFANILAPTLVELADDLRRVTRPGGRLVISGVLDGRHDHVLAALAPLVVERTDVDAGWAAVTLRR